MTLNDRLTTALADRYRIEREIGSGGMATVYLAHDVKHDRRVALKVLRPELAAVIGAERFLTEIKTTANLQHPHILALFDSGQVDGTVFYVMPYVEGESLRDRLTREKQLPVPDAVRIATEVASALDYAHRHDVIHRDIKPENVLLHDGRALVADFGIALAASKTEGGARMTETGMSLGTPHYMSPEQAMGERSLDARTDVYALGCVLYEMLTAEPPFTGATAQAIMARVMTEEPRSLTMQRRTVPPNVEAAVRTALEKLPADRFETAAEFSKALADRSYAAASPALGGTTGGIGALDAAGATVVALPESRAQAIWRRVGTPLLLVAALAGFGLFARERMRPAAAPSPVVRVPLELSSDVMTTLGGQVIALSPDGSRMVYVGASAAGRQLFSRVMDNESPVPIPGTDDALSPFFSPDGRQIAFVATGKLLKMDLAGGPALTVAELSGEFRGGTWSEGDSILYSSDGVLMIVPARGGTPQVLATSDSGSSEEYRWPEFLPGGRQAVLSVFDGVTDRLATFDLETRRIVITDVPGANARFVQQGFLVLALISEVGSSVTAGTLVAVPFDPARLRVLGASVPIAEDVQMGTTTRTAKMGASRSGALAFATGDIGQTKLVMLDRSGVARDLGADARGYVFPRLSPDGRRVAATVADGGNNIWIFDLADKTLTRLTFEVAAMRPLWTPDGRHIAFTRRGEDGRLNVWRIQADGGAPAEPLVEGTAELSPGAFTPDGRTLILLEFSAGSKRSIAVAPLDSQGTIRTLLQSAFDHYAPTLSPDGRWIAYASDESGRYEVYVRPFPGPGGRWQVSTAGGEEPIWSPTGREIFFRSGQRMMVAAVQTGASFSRGEVRELFVNATQLTRVYQNFDVTRDGRHLIMPVPEGATDQKVILLLNRFENLKARSPQ